MKNLLLFTLASLFLFTGNLLAQVEVINEHGKNMWNFSSILRPSQSDAALHSKITVVGNKPLASCLSLDGMHNGVLPQENRLLRDFFCFENNSSGGKIVMDLGKEIPVAMINSYSAHGPVGGTTWCSEFDGSRGPQVYTLYATASLKPNFHSLSGKEWIKIAEVDTRPDNEKEDWQGTYGVNVKKADGSLLGNLLVLRIRHPKLWIFTAQA